MITALPTPPSRQDPANFNDRADAFLSALPLFQTEANALQVNVNTSEVNAVNSAAAVLAATNIVKWVSGTTYASGAVVWSPINGLGYRRITASGSGTTDPSLDTTNYKQVNGTGDVSTSGNQTISGIKTFTNEIISSGNITAYSDERLKTNWRDLPPNFIEELAKVKMGVYDRTDNGLTQVGVGAGSLMNVLPWAVNKGEEGVLSVAYGNAALVAAVTLSREIVSLKEQIITMQEQLNSLKG